MGLTAVPPDLSSNSQSYTAAVELIIVTQSKSEEPTVMPNVAVAAAELLPIPGADGLSGDQEPVMPLIISDSSTLKVVTMSPSRDTQEAEETLNMAEPPTLASPDAPVPTSVSVREPAVTEPSVNLDLTHIPTPSKAGAPGTDPDLTTKSKQVDKLPEDAALAEEDTTTLSAPTVLSGDGEDHDPPSYAHLRETDSDPELVSQYDSADAFLPVSRDAVYPICFLNLHFLFKTSLSFPLLPASDWNLYLHHRSNILAKIPVFDSIPALPVCLCCFCRTNEENLLLHCVNVRKRFCFFTALDMHLKY
ncbi:hypothetical protein GOODEAATRI_028504 [Goodea atripinnis]|uniref:Uncharacterized protein n=1 Tax=Goodea atripinnis TaxID=208336 RepID=A0ABV0MLI8_9TELE